MTIQPCADILARDVSVFTGSTHTTPIETRTPRSRAAAHSGRDLSHLCRRPYGISSPVGTMHATGWKKKRAPPLRPVAPCIRGQRICPGLQKLLSTTGLVHFDLDHLDDPEAMKRQLAQDDHVAFAFVSPSGQGLKIGVAASGITGPEDYKHAWVVVLDALKRTYPAVHFNEDPHVRFLHALCYVSDDPHLYVNGQAVPYVVPPPAPSPPPPRRMDTPPDYARVAEALACIPNHDADYDTWLMLGMALHSTGEAWARDLWDSWSRQSDKCDARKQAKSWGSFTRDGQVTIASLFHLAKQHGYAPPPKATPHGGARNGHVRAASGAAQQHDATGNGQADTHQTGPPVPDGVDAARQAADSLLHQLAILPEEAREDAVLDALPTLASLDMIRWMRLKRQVKTAVPALNLYDLERARQELRRTAAPAGAPRRWPLPGPDRGCPRQGLCRAVRL